ncbi:hypothetical protein A1O1_03633 [Capronia coronata CBS 617.96]|uniref:Cytochrome oxidase c assembly-domain-containing protein n=1 Tax=Capronia coronata CBS 617.96 TaxID=1182541 RepID=W9YLH8_9EURO|nr:uncharacterized protein A1O1_03633 [Capronia coronata CBS 617.96]EXJ90530.1 hypothetical protein A1O1_03633 [Capronia coronata CBS 617.96]
MSRRPPSDAFTRFTSTTPHAMQRPATTFTYQPASRPAADARPSPNSSSSSPSSPPNSQQPPRSQGPPGETPQERVARLRAAARAAKEQAAYSPVERVIEVGRRWADRAHRFTTYGLLLFAGVSTVVAAYGTTSLIAHNRRQKRAWIERELDRLDAARQAFLRGEANAEQLHLLEQERAGHEMESARNIAAEKKKNESYWSKIKGMLGGQMAKGEMGQETEAERLEREARQARRQQQQIAGEGFVEGEVRPVAVAESGIKGVGVDSKGRPVPANKVEYLATKIEEERRAGEKEVTAHTRSKGGPLDALASNVADAVKPSTESQGWLSWIRGSKS